MNTNVKSKPSAEFLPVSAKQPEILPKKFKSIQVIVICDRERITFNKEFSTGDAAKWYLESFICTMKSLFQFAVTNRMN